MENDEGIGGPHLAAAFLCEKVLREGDGVPSIIRIFDRYNIRGTSSEMPPSPIQATVFVSLKAGSLATGKYRIRLRPRKPDGGYLKQEEFPVFFEGGPDRGVNIIGQMAFLIQEEGLYWIDVLFEDATLTRIPLRILYQRIQSSALGT